MLHGLLHLLGMDHESEGGKMARAEERWRARLNLPNGLIARVHKIAWCSHDAGGSPRDHDRPASSLDRHLRPIAIPREHAPAHARLAFAPLLQNDARRQDRAEDRAGKRVLLAHQTLASRAAWR